MLHKFKDDLSGGNDTKKPPFAISAGKLDKNFGLCYLIPVDGNNADYGIDRSSDGGYKLILFPNRPTSGTHVLGSVNGALQWIATEECGETQTNP